VVVNDFGSIPIDPVLMRGTDALSVSHGCACCTQATDLLLAVGRLLSRRPAPEQVLIEASGVSDPRRIAEAIVLHGLRLDGIVVLADAEGVRGHGEDAMVGPWVRHQLDSADLIVLNKTDLVSRSERDSVRHWISEVAPKAHVVETSRGQVPVSLVLADADADERPVAQRQVPQGRPAHPEFGSWGSSLAAALDGAAFRWWAASLPEPILRGKGILSLAEDPLHRYVFQLVGGRWSLERGEPWEGEPRQSRITLIGRASGIDERWLDMTIARCVAGQARRGA
jgi:G3E family GTPase